MTINIIKHNLKFTGSMSAMGKVNTITLHHEAGNDSETVEQVHAQHLGQKWAGIGYHYVVYRDGSIHEGRPVQYAGAHVTNHNTGNIGISVVGNYQSRNNFTPEAKQACIDLLTYLKGIHGNVPVKKHSDFMATACPGVYFPFNEIVGGKAQDTVVNTPTKPPVTNNGGWEWLRRWQTEINAQGFANPKLVVDGIAGDKTLNASPIIKKGAKGNLTKLLQEVMINGFGISCGASGVDGDFGAGTETAIKTFQGKNGLSQDGVVGKNTYKKIFGL